MWASASMATWPRLDWIQAAAAKVAPISRERAELVLPVARDLEEVAAEHFPGEHHARRGNGERGQDGEPAR